LPKLLHDVTERGADYIFTKGEKRRQTVLWEREGGGVEGGWYARKGMRKTPRLCNRKILKGGEWRDGTGCPGGGGNYDGSTDEKRKGKPEEPSLRRLSIM